MKKENIEKSVEKIIQALEAQLDVQEIRAQQLTKQEQKLYAETLKKSKISDKRLEYLLKEQLNATGEYATRVKELTNAYIKEQQALNKLSSKDMSQVQEIFEKQQSTLEKRAKEEKLTKAIERKKELSNPLNALKHAFEDYKEERKKDKIGLKAISKSGLTLGQGLKESAKQQLTFKNFTKGLLHTVGATLDLPALNILASSIESDVKDRKETNAQMLSLLEKMEDIQGDTKSETISNAKDFSEHEKDVLDNQMDFISEIKNLKDIVEGMHKELNDDLVSIYVENSDLTKYFKEYLYLQRDLIDDQKKIQPGETASQIEAKEINNANNTAKTSTTDKGDTNILGGVSGDWWKKTKAGGSKAVSKLGGAGKAVSKLGAPIAALMAGYDKYTDVSEDTGLTNAQKTTQVASTGIGAGGGAVAGAMAGAALGSVVPVVGTLIGGLAGGALGALAGTKLGETVGEYMSSFMASDKESTGFVNQLESAGIVNTSWVGDSKVQDWNKVNLLNSKQLEAMIKYDDWDSATLSLLKELYEAKKIKEGIEPASLNEPNIVSQAANTDMRSVQKATLPSINELNARTSDTSSDYKTPPQPIVIQQGGGEKKIDSLAMSDADVLLNDRGKGR